MELSSKPEVLTPIGKIKKCNELVMILEDKGVSEALLTLPGGENALSIFKSAVEREIESLISDSVVTVQLSDAQTLIKSMVDDIKDLQECLVASVQQAMQISQSSGRGASRRQMQAMQQILPEPVDTGSDIIISVDGMPITGTEPVFY